MKRLALGLLVLVSAISCADPGFVKKITIANPFEFNVLAEVSGDGDSWLSLGGIDREREEAVEDIIDMGERWIFRFRYPGVDVAPADVSLTRTELEAARWRVQVPASLAENLRKRGEPASYAN